MIFFFNTSSAELDATQWFTCFFLSLCFALLSRLEEQARALPVYPEYYFSQPFLCHWCIDWTWCDGFPFEKEFCKLLPFNFVERTYVLSHPSFRKSWVCHCFMCTFAYRSPTWPGSFTTARPTRTCRRPSSCFVPPAPASSRFTSPSRSFPSSLYHSTENYNRTSEWPHCTSLREARGTSL